MPPAENRCPAPAARLDPGTGREPPVGPFTDFGQFGVDHLDTRVVWQDELWVDRTGTPIACTTCHPSTSTTSRLPPGPRPGVASRRSARRCHRPDQCHGTRRHGCLAGARPRAPPSRPLSGPTALDRNHAPDGHASTPPPSNAGSDTGRRSALGKHPLIGRSGKRLQATHFADPRPSRRKVSPSANPIGAYRQTGRVELACETPACCSRRLHRGRAGRLTTRGHHRRTAAPRPG
jgi:hypothetical protein